MKYLITRQSGPASSLSQDEPLVRFIDGHLQQWSFGEVGEILPDMDEVFTYIGQLIEEFCRHNTWYKKPSGFIVTYSKPSCCPSAITIAYGTYKITITKKDLLNDPLPVARESSLLSWVAMAMIVVVLSGCFGQRELTGKQVVAKQQKELMFKGYKKHRR